ncbi:MAG: DUF4381 domain-containing protein [Ruminobacter sp.]|nr:DUF4381 domain-containing protein [Ruminobacter sp.]
MDFDFSLLREIHEGAPPVDVSYFWIWYLVVFAVLCFVFYSIYRLIPLFQAYRKLVSIDMNKEAFIPLVNYWLKETSLIMYPRDTVAPLYGLNWLRFLDKTGGTNFEAFTNAWELVIYDYKKIEVPMHERKLLVKECKKWLFANIRRRIWIQH